MHMVIAFALFGGCTQLLTTTNAQSETGPVNWEPTKTCLVVASFYLAIADHCRPRFRLGVGEDCPQINDLFDLARKFIRMYLRFEKCGIARINQRCREEIKKFSKIARDAVPFAGGLALEDIFPCGIDSLNRLLSLCAGERPLPYRWPDDIYNILKEKYTTCAQPKCPPGGNARLLYFWYHNFQGQDYPEDYPQNFGQDVLKDILGPNAGVDSWDFDKVNRTLYEHLCRLSACNRCDYKCGFHGPKTHVFPQATNV